MANGIPPEIQELWNEHDNLLRHPGEVVAGWFNPEHSDPRLLEHEVTGDWWGLLQELGITLLATREYEHLVMALRNDSRTGPDLSVMRLPHPSGLAVDRSRGLVHVAATRNPNQIFDLAPLDGFMSRPDLSGTVDDRRPLMPIRSRFFPGCMYMHDLAMVGNELFANAVGHNAVVKLHPGGSHEVVWWPKCIETANGPLFGRNYLQLNSIAAGETIEKSFFSASADRVSDLVPGDADFPVDKRGVIFSGETREPIARGLTRPHSARLHQGRVWVDNSGYGEAGFVEDGKFRVVARLPGWTRGLCFVDRIMFVGTSRVLPRFRQYAPGLDLESSVCGIHAVDPESGQSMASITWPVGSQIFAIDWVETGFATGLPFHPDREMDKERSTRLFYSFRVGCFKED